MRTFCVVQEEKAELRAENYLLSKEKSSVHLQLCGKESREQAYLVQIEHLRRELSECRQRLGGNDDGRQTGGVTGRQAVRLFRYLFC